MVFGGEYFFFSKMFDGLRIELFPLKNILRRRAVNTSERSTFKTYKTRAFGYYWITEEKSSKMEGADDVVVH